MGQQGRTRGRIMKKTLLLCSLAGLFLQAGTKVVPAEQVVDSEPSQRPHSAPETGTGLRKKTSLGCLQFMAEEQRQRASTVATTHLEQPRSGSPDGDRTGSISPGSIHGVFHIKGAKGRPVKTTIIIGGTSKDGEKEKKESHKEAVMEQVGAIAEEQALGAGEDGEEDEEEDEESSCMDQAGACCKKVFKFVVGLAVCL